MGISALLTDVLKMTGQGFAMYLDFGLGPFNLIRDSVGLWLFQITVWMLYMITIYNSGIVGNLFTVSLEEDN